MIKTGNPNHPQKGSTIKVDPIKKLKDIKAIKKILANKPRDLALFTLGINTNLRASNLLRLRIGQGKDLKAGDALEIKEKKTSKVRRITLNKAYINVIQNLLTSKQYQDIDHLFQSQRRHVLTVPSVHKLVKSWCSEINLKGNYSFTCSRKTWGYHQRVTFGVDLPRLMVCFNHSTHK